MANKIIRLTNAELSSLLYDISMSVSNDKNKEKYIAALKVYDDGYKDKLAQISSDTSTFDNELAAEFSGSKFLFFAEDGVGIFNRVIFILKSVSTLNKEKIVLNGIAIFNTEAKAGKVYITNGIVKIIWNRTYYNLEPDNRTKPLWDELLNLLT